jgi:hypothetical protein
MLFQLAMIATGRVTFFGATTKRHGVLWKCILRWFGSLQLMNQPLPVTRLSLGNSVSNRDRIIVC